jgi:hypothetical protein
VSRATLARIPIEYVWAILKFLKPNNGFPTVSEKIFRSLSADGPIKWPPRIGHLEEVPRSIGEPGAGWERLEGIKNIGLMR